MSTQTKKEIFWRNIEKARQWEKDRPARELEKVRGGEAIRKYLREVEKLQNKAKGLEFDREVAAMKRISIPFGNDWLEGRTKFQCAARGCDGCRVCK